MILLYIPLKKLEYHYFLKFNKCFYVIFDIEDEMNTFMHTILIKCYIIILLMVEWF